jgi:two-component system, sensor histidine kinase and response regulator
MSADQSSCNASSSKAAGFNLSELLARVENDRELLQELVSIFKNEFPRQLQDLRDAIVRQDTARVASLSHALKGMLTNLAVMGAADGAFIIEKLARQGDQAALGSAFADFERQVQGLLPEMEACLTEVRP